MQLIADVALALVPTERVDALVLTSVVVVLKALIELLYEGGREAGLIHRTVRDKLDVEMTAVGANVRRQSMAAEFARQIAVRRMAVSNFEVIVHAVVVVLYFKRLKLECNLVLWRDGDPPDALLVRSILIRVIRTL